MLQNKSKNIFWINAIKAICIIAVYFVHCQIYCGCWLKYANVFIHPVYVNAFFVVSGYLLFRKQLTEPLKGQKFIDYIGGGGRTLACNIVSKIVIPTVLFSLIEYLPKKMLRGEPIVMHTFLSNTIGGGTYWFTSALVIAEIVILLLLLTRCKNVWFYFIGGLLIAAFGWYLIRIDFHLFGFGRDPWAYRRGLLAVAFIMTGGVYWRYEEQIAKLMKWHVLVCLLVTYVLIFSLFSEKVPVLISTMDITWEGYLASLLGCVILIEICKKLKTVRFLTFVGQYSLCFYFLSGALPMLVSMGTKHFLPTDNVLVLLLVLALCLLISTSVTYVLNRYLPFIFDLRTIMKKN